MFFENQSCVNCKRVLAYVPQVGEVVSLDLAAGQGQQNLYQSEDGKQFRLCQNYVEHNVCNWAMPADDSNAPYCPSCQLTRKIPDLSVEGHKAAWYKLEVAKRRLVYTLKQLGLPVTPKSPEAPNGLTFEFLADPDPNSGAPAVLTGHADGVITVNLAEADDAERERRKAQMGEPYRTLLGHFRHEVGHYYWDVLIKSDESRLAAFRDVFGDDRQDYGAALQKHYAEGAPADWQDRFVSEYATAHAWEDWAETWAHYLHMTDTLETAADCGLSLKPRRRDKPAIAQVADPVGDDPVSFQAMMRAWNPVTYALNNLNRGLGIADAYPFVLSPPAVEKLRFVHDLLKKR